MTIPGTAVAWQGFAAFVAGFLAIITAVGALVAHRERTAQAADVRGWLTGGDSFPHLYPVVVGLENARKAVAYFIRVRGEKYPVYDVHIYVQDLDHSPRLSDGSVLPLRTIPALGTLTGNTDKFPVGSPLIFPFPSADETAPRHFRVEITRNGLVLQDITLTPSEGRWLTQSTPITRNHRPIDVDIEETK